MDTDVKGKKRPDRVTHQRVPVMDKKPVKELRDIPAHYILAQQGNPDIHSCCKDVNNLTFQAFKTNPDYTAPNLGVLECGVCGRKHYRVAHSPGRP